MFKYYIIGECDDCYMGEYDDFITCLNVLNHLRLTYKNDENFKFKLVIGYELIVY